MDSKLKSWVFIITVFFCNLVFAQAPWWCKNQTNPELSMGSIEYTPKTKVCTYKVRCPQGKCDMINITTAGQSASLDPFYVSNVSLNQKSGAQFDKLPADAIECGPTTATNLAVGDKNVALQDGSKKDGPTSCVIRLVNVKVDSLEQDDILVTYQLGGGQRLDVKLIK